MEFFGFPTGAVGGEVAGFTPTKLKRKELEEVYDDFSDFSLSSPARKIRRLDAELPPIMEEEEPAAALLFGRSMQEEPPGYSSSGQVASAGLADAGPSNPTNEERAIVLYKPVSAPLFNQNPSWSNVLVDVDPDMIANFKSRAFWRDRSSMTERRDEKAEASVGVGQAPAGSCMAVVPWTPSHLPEAATGAGVSGAQAESVDEEEVRMASEDAASADVAPMDMEVEVREASGTGAEAEAGASHGQRTGIFL